jgi:hypothetical protein
LLEQVLDSHPDVVSAEETEIFNDYAYTPLTRDESGQSKEAYLLTILDQAKTAQLRMSRANYMRAMERILNRPVGQRLLIDKNPSLTFMIPGFARIYPEAKYLVALRDPRDVCLSCFMQCFWPLGQVSAAYLSLETTAKEYADLMSTWTVLAPLMRGRGLEVRYEDMVDDLETVSRRVIDFLGLPWDAAVLRFNEHAQKKVVRSPTYADVTKPVFKTAVGRWRHYEKYFGGCMEKLQPFLKAFGYEGR